MSLIFAFAAAVLQSSASQLPAAQVQSSPNTEHVTVQFVRAKDVQPVPFEYVDNLIMIEAELAGQQGWMMIDTGSAHSVIDRGLAKELGRTIVPMKGGITTLGGHKVPQERVDDIALVIAHHFSVRMPMLAIDLASFSRATHRRVMGIIGNDIVSNMLLWVMKPQGQLILQPGGKFNLKCSGPCTDVSSLQPIPITRMTGHEDVVASVGGRSLKLKIDTGDASGVDLTAAAWAQVKPADAQVFTRTSTGASGITDKVQSSRLPEVTLGAKTIDDVRVDVQRFETADEDGVLGMEVLGRYSFALNARTGQLWLFPAPADTSNLPPPVISKPADAPPATSHP
jgi:predicted aspartyl protease